MNKNCTGNIRVGIVLKISNIYRYKNQDLKKKKRKDLHVPSKANC